MRRLTSLIVLAAFIFSCGGNWAVLQGIAWANMIREYSQTVPLTQAVEMTFSGEHPCALCQAIAEKKDSGPQKTVELEKYEKKFPLPVAIAPAALQVVAIQYREYVAVAVARTETPPTPPPRPALS